eukprot:jgi/Ulvmu1/248/UM001_0252.1
MFRPGHAVFEQALPPQTRTVQVSSDARVPQPESTSCIGKAVSAGSLSGAIALMQPGRALCWELEPAERCLTVREVIADQDWQPEACQWRFAFDLLPSVCSYSHQDIVTLLLFARDGSVITLSIGTAPRPQGCLANPRDTTERSQYPLASALPGPVTAMAVCQHTLCLACQSTETPLIAIPLSELAAARPGPLRESKTVRQWVSGLLGTSQPPQIACLAAVPLLPADSASTKSSPHRLLAVLYTNGLLSVWEADSGRHLCQMMVGSLANGQHAEAGAPPVSVSGLAACDWPGAPGSAMLITQTDELSGMRSARRTFAVARLTATHNGRSASLALVDTLNMSAVAACTHAGALRDARWALADAPTLEGTPEAVGQIQAAVVVDAAARRVAVLTHVGVSAHAFVLYAPDAGGLLRVMGAVLTREDSLQQQLFSDPAAAHIFDRLHSQALHLLAASCIDPVPPADGLSVLDASLPSLLSPAHFDARALSQALQHVGHTASATVLRGCSSTELARHVRAAAAAAARNHKVPPLQVLAQLCRRYMHVRAAEGAALTLVDLSHGGRADAGAAALAAPLLLRRGVGVSCVRVVAHPGSVLLKPVEPPLQDRQAALQGLLQAAVAAGGACAATWPLELVRAADVPLADAFAAMAQSIVRGVPGGPYPMQPSAENAQVMWREKRRKLLLLIQTLIGTAGCMDVLQELDAAEQQLAQGPDNAVAASALHACTAVAAVADLTARYACSAALLLQLLLACGSADGSALQPQHISRIRNLLQRFMQHAARSGAVLLLRDSWASDRSLDATVDSLQIADMAMSGSAAQGGLAAKPSLLAVLATPFAADMHARFSGGSVVIALDLIRHGARDALTPFSRLAAAHDVAAAGPTADPNSMLVRGLCALATADGASGESGFGAVEAPLAQWAASAALPLLCGAVDQASLLQAAAAGSTQQVRAFEEVVRTVYRSMCAVAAPSLAESPPLFEAAYFEALSKLAADTLGQPAAAAELTTAGLQRIASTAAPSSPDAEELCSFASRLRVCRYSYLCDAEDWDGAYAAVLLYRDQQTISDIRGVVRRAAAARQLRRLLTWTFPGVIELPVGDDVGAEGAEDWVHAQPCVAVALDELARCAHSRQHAADLPLCKLLYGLRMANGDVQGAADAMLQFAAHAHENPGAFADAAAAARSVLAALTHAAGVLQGAPATQRWADAVPGALTARGRWQGDVNDEARIFSQLADSASETELGGVVIRVADIHAECARLRAVLLLLSTAQQGAPSTPDAALTIPPGRVFRLLVQAQRFTDAAECARACAPHGQFLVRALKCVAASMAGACVAGRAAAAADSGGGMPVSWKGLHSLLERLESPEWLQGASYHAARCRTLQPPGCLRAAAAQEVLKTSHAITLPPFLLPVFMTPPQRPVRAAACSAHKRVACSVSAAATLRCLIDAGHLQTASQMIEDYLQEWQEVTPLQRQQAGASWLPWSSVSLLLRLLKERGHRPDAAALEQCIQQYHALAKTDSQALSINSQRFMNAVSISSGA